MRIVDLPLDLLVPAPWNPNEMDPAIRERLRRSIEQFGMVAPLVVRPLGDGRYETVNGAQRLGVLREKGRTSLTCVAVDVDDVQARLLSQALNHIAGEDNPGMRASLLRQVLEAVGEDEVAGLLPESIERIRELCSLGQEELADALRKLDWQQAVRLRHLQFQLTTEQLKVVEAALRRATTVARRHRADSPNPRGVALSMICAAYLEREERL